MIRGTTPLLTFDVPFDPAISKRLWITFSQNNTEIFTIERDTCTFNENTISVTLTQKQTLSLMGNSEVDMQIRVSFANGDTDEALASDIITAPVRDILKDGEI